jgi:hypothetical protein
MADADLSQFIVPAKPSAPPAGTDLSSFMTPPKTAAPAAKPAGPDLSGFMGKLKDTYRADVDTMKTAVPGFEGAHMPRVPDMPHPIKDAAAAAQAEGHKFMEKYRGQKTGGRPPGILDTLAVPGAAVGAALESVSGKPLSQATGLPQKDIDTALLAGAPEAGAAKVAEGLNAARGLMRGEGKAAKAGEALKAEAPVAATAKPAPDLSEFMGKPKAAPDLSSFMEAPKPKASEHVAGPVVGAETDPVERVDNALYRLGGHATADRIELAQAIKAMPEEVRDPKIQEELYHAIEQKMVDPNAVIPEHLQPAMDAMRPYYEEQTSLINKIRARGDPELEPYLEDQGYVARRVKGQSPLMDSGPGAQPKDPILGKRSLVSKAQAQKQRTAGFMVTDQDGKTHFAPEVNETDIKGRPYTSTRPATTAEIEKNRPGLEYHKNALANTIDNVARLRRVDRNLQVLDELKKNLTDAGLAHRDYHYFKNEQGQMVKVGANSKAPDGFKTLPHIPQLDGYSWSPDVAEAVKDYYPGPDEPLDSILSKVNQMMTASLFITPIPHVKNVGTMWTVGRGWDWMDPGAYPRLMRTGSQAMNEVLTLGPKYRQMLREGSALMSGDTATKDFYKSMLELTGNNIEADPKLKSTIQKAFGMPVDITKALYDASHKALWSASDMLMLQRQLELEQKGMSSRKAISEAEKWIANYRVPPQVLKSRAFSQFVKNGTYLQFGRYTYGKFKALGEMAKIASKDATPAERADIAGKIAVLGILSLFLYPLMDKAVQKVSGNDQARVSRGGEMTPLDAVNQLSKGEKDWSGALSSFITPAPLIEKGMEVKNNRYAYSGQNIVEPEASPLGKAAEGAEYAAQPLYPLELGIGALKPGGAAQSAGRVFGVDLPTVDPDVQKAKRQKYGRRTAKGREKKDPLENLLKGLDQ